MPKSLKTRIQNKHDIEANWLLASNFVPLAGEIIIYDPDETHDLPRVKIGDGETLVNNLKFIDADLADALELVAAGKADKDHKHDEYATETYVEEKIAEIPVPDVSSQIDNLISCGTTDPSAAITSRFYFKYATE